MGGGNHYIDGSYYSHTRQENEGLNCSSLEITTHIISPDMELMQEVVVGQELDVQLENDIVIIIYNTKSLGAINSSSILSLIKCIRGGTVYKAKVLEKDGAQCKVKIHAL